MSEINAFVTPEYPVLFSVGEGTAAAMVPPDHAAVSLAVLVRGMPSFLATHPVALDKLESVAESLESGDVRVAVVGLRIAMEEEGPVPGESRERPAAFVSVICADGRRLTVARIVGRRTGHSPERLARFIIKQIAQGVQVPDLASAR